jgi:hypothetical protein
LIWVFAPHASIRRIGSMVVALFPLAVIAMAVLPPSFLLMAGVAVIFGAFNGIMTIVRGMAVPEMLSRQSYGAINGALTGPSLLAKALAPAGGAALWAMTQNYDGVIIAIFAGALITAIGFWTATLLSVRAGRVAD